LKKSCYTTLHHQVCPQVNAEHVAIKQLNIACNWYL